MPEFPLRFDDEEGYAALPFAASDSTAIEAPRRVRGSFSAVVLLLTFTLGVGVAASYLAPGLSGEPSSPFGTGAAPGQNQSNILPIPNITNPTNQTQGQNGTTPPHYANNGTNSSNGTGGHNSTGNTTTGGTHGNTTNTTNQTTGGPGPNGTSNRTKAHAPLGPRKVAVDRLPWFPWQPELLIGIAAFTSIGTLLALVLLDSIRPPPASALDPWRFEFQPRRRSGPSEDPRRAVGEAARKLEAALGGEDTLLAREEVRARIFELYGALLAAVAPALGELRARTPREVEWLSVRYLGLTPGTARNLTALFEEARYSSHAIRPEALPSARLALQELLRDLRWFSER
ncbi:MAG: DUF4129 domain-containing protein [Thermoplasmata archaeon]|nr:DUF4129 domain-containing protein [Thermoplasmata archaeon]